MCLVSPRERPRTRAHRRRPAPPRLASLRARLRRTALNEYQLCVEKRGKEDPSCVQRGRDYGSMCPQKWVEDWKGDVAKGIGMTVGKDFMEK